MTRILAVPRDPGPFQPGLYGPMAHRHGVRYLDGPTPSRSLNLLLVPALLVLHRLGGVRVLHVHWLFGFVPAWAAGRRIARPFRWWTRACLHLARRLGMRVLWTAHNTLPHAPVFDDDLAARRSLVAVCDAIVAPTHAGAEEIRRRFAPRCPVTTIPLAALPVPEPVRPAATVRAGLEVDDDAVLLAFVGRIERYKGVTDLVAALGLLAGRDGCPPVTLVVAGECRDAALAAELTATAEAVVVGARDASGRDDGVPTRPGAAPAVATVDVRLHLRRLTDLELADLLGAADGVVLPFREITTSASVVHAMTAGAACLVPDLLAFADLPVDALLRYAPGRGDTERVTALADALYDLVTADDDLRAAVGSRAALHAGRLDPARIAGRYADLVTDLVAGATGRRASELTAPGRPRPGRPVPFRLGPGAPPPRPAAPRPAPAARPDMPTGPSAGPARRPTRDPMTPPVPDARPAPDPADRVVLLTPWAPAPDGLARHSADLAAALRAAGTEVAVVTASPGPDQDVDDDPDGTVEVVRLRHHAPYSARAITAAVRSRGAATVHVQFTIPAWGAATPAVLRACRRLRRRGIRVVVTVHEVTREIDLLGPVARRLFRALGAAADRLVVHTPSAADGLVAAGLDPSRIATVPHGAFPGPVAAPTPDDGPVPHDRSTVLCFGYLHPDKGLERAVDAAARVPGARLVVAGAVRPRRGVFRLFGRRDHAYATELQRRARSIGAPVELPGHVDDDHLDALLRRATVVVLPYRTATQSGVLNRAVAAGAALVVTDLPGLRADLPASAAVVPADDPACTPALAAVLADLLDDPERLAAMRADVRDRRDAHGPAAVAAALRAVYAGGLPTTSLPPVPAPRAGDLADVVAARPGASP